MSIDEELLPEIKTVLDGHPEVDLHMVLSRVKDLSSVERNVREKSDVKKVLECGDLVGFRIICHCQSDVDPIVSIIRAYLTNKIGKANYEVKSMSKSKEDGYEGTHIKFSSEKNGVNIPCEIQVRTVLQDAWAVQSRHFLYARPKEGESNRLAVAVSGIHASCEDLWELVREKIGGTGQLANFQSLTEDIEEDLYGLRQQELVEKIDGLLTNMTPDNEIEIEEILEDSLSKLTVFWKSRHPEIKSPNEIPDLLGEMEKMMFDFKVIGLLSIKKNKTEILKKVLDYFGKIAGLANGMGGYTSLISVPFAILHDTYYSLGVYSLKRTRQTCLSLLLNYQVTWSFDGRFTSEPIWGISSIFAPDINRSAVTMFDRMLKGIEEESEEVRDIIHSTKEEFLSLACSFNMLFALRAMKLQEELGEKDYVWCYPNFARFYANRVDPTVSQLRDTRSLETFIREAFEESMPDFNKRAQRRLGILASRGLGSGAFWSSIRTWNRE